MLGNRSESGRRGEPLAAVLAPPGGASCPALCSCTGAPRVLLLPWLLLGVVILYTGLFSFRLRLTHKPDHLLFHKKGGKHCGLDSLLPWFFERGMFWDFSPLPAFKAHSASPGLKWGSFLS